jgi:hypothetical protein
MPASGYQIKLERAKQKARLDGMILANKIVLQRNEMGGAQNRSGDFSQVLERVMGIEPTYAAWEAAVLPLNYTRNGAGISRHFCV